MKKKNRWKKLLAGFMAMILTFVMMPISQTKAGDGDPSPVIDESSFDSEGRFVVNNDMTCASVTIPADRKLVIEGGKNLTVTGTITIKRDGELTLNGDFDGTMTLTAPSVCTGTITAEDGARMFAAHENCIPASLISGISGSKICAPDGTPYTAGNVPMFKTFIYDTTADKWMEEPEPPIVELDLVDFNITSVEYSWDGTNYTGLDLNDGPHDDINTHYDCDNQHVVMIIPDSAMVGSEGEKNATIYLKITSPDELAKPDNVADGDFTHDGDLYTLHTVVLDEQHPEIGGRLDFHEPAPPHVSIVINGAFNTADAHCSVAKIEYQKDNAGAYTEISEVNTSYRGDYVEKPDYVLGKDNGDSLLVDILYADDNYPVDIIVTMESGKVINHAFKQTDPDPDVPLDELIVSTPVASFTHRFSTADLKGADVLRRINLTAIYENQGKGDLVSPTVLDKFIYGYSETDGTDGALKEKLADEFWERCKFGSSHPDDIFCLTNYHDLENRITITPGGTITATLSNGSTQSIDYRNFTIQFGVDQDGAAVTYSNKVFILPTNSADPYIIIGLVNGGTTTYQLRKYSEQSPLGSVNDPTPGDHRSKACNAVLVYASFDKVLVGGDSCAINEDLNDASGVFATQCMWGRMTASNRGAGSDKNTHLRVLDNRDTFAVISGGVKDSAGNIVAAYECPAFDINNYDNIAETGIGREKTVFAGYDYLTINPLLDATGATTGKITSITTVPSCQDGVIITAPTGADVEWTVEFLSAYYCTVPLTITYENHIVAPLTINRTGLVIYADWVDDSGEYKPYIGHEQVDGNPGSIGNQDPLRYTLEQGPVVNGEQLHADTVLVYAVYFHPQTNKTTDGDDNLNLIITYDNVNQFGDKYHIDAYNSTMSDNQQVVQQTFYKNDLADGSKHFVPFTTFAIGTYNATDYPVDASGIIQPVDRKDVYVPSFSALVVADTYNDTTTFGGTQIGTGKGVHYDGHAVWVAK